MLANILCQSFISNALTSIHKKTKQSLINHVQSLLGGQAKLSLSSMGRNLPGKADVKHKINMCWRFLSNKKIHDNLFFIYKHLFHPVLSELHELVVAVDWSGCCTKDIHMLRASLVYQGRSITIYNEIHPQKKLGTEEAHKAFLNNLYEIIPRNKPVVIVTDGGFKTPWFNQVEQLGWFFVGRVRNAIHYQLDSEKEWNPIETLHQFIKREETKSWGLGRLSKHSSTQMTVSFAGHWGRPKHRKAHKPRYPDAEKQYSTLNSEPLILVSNLHNDERLQGEQQQKSLARAMKEIYEKRMQIEQNFRDEKSERFGLGWRFSRTRNVDKISVMILISTIAMFVLWLIGYKAEKRKLHYKYQANTIRSKRVLSLPFLAKQVITHSMKALKIRKLTSIIRELHLDYNEKSTIIPLETG